MKAGRMRISRFFSELRSAYQAEIDDLTFDSEGRDVLRQRLAEKRKEIGFLRQMIELSPEMVAVVFHQGFQFKLPAAMEHLLAHESDELPPWDSFASAVQMRPWTQALVEEVRKEPMGEWLLTVAAGLEYLYSKPAALPVQQGHDDDEAPEDEAEQHDDQDGDEYGIDDDSNDEADARRREEAGADWMVEQGFDRKD